MRRRISLCVVLPASATGGFVPPPPASAAGWLVPPRPPVLFGAPADAAADADAGADAAASGYVSPETIRFNNDLVAMSQAFDRQTAGLVEDRLLAALDLAMRDESHGGHGDVSAGDGNGGGGGGEGRVLVRPNVVTFTAACSSWARSSHPHAARRAQKLLDRARRPLALGGVP